MQVTRRTDYAVRILVELARSGGGGPISVRRLAEDECVPYSFARSIQRDLVSGGLVETRPGVGGGLALARPAADITVLQILEAVQGPLSCSVCTSDPDWCGRRSHCDLHRLWEGADALLRDYLGSKTLAGLVSDQGK